MKLVIFAVADEGHFINTGDSYGRVIKLDDSDKIATLNEITDEEYYELFPDERPVEEVIEGEDAPEGEETPEEIPEDEPTEPIAE